MLHIPRFDSPPVRAACKPLMPASRRWTEASAWPRAGDLPGCTLGLPVDLQIRQALHEIHRRAAQPGAAAPQAGRLRCRLNRRTPTGKPNSYHQPERQQRERQLQVEARDVDKYDTERQDGGEGRRQGAHIKIFQRLDIAQDARQQIPAAVAQQPRRGQRLQRLVKPDPQARQQPESGLVRQVALQIAEQSAGDAKKAHPDNRHLQDGDRGLQGGLRDDISRGRHQPDPAQHRGGARQDG